MKHFLIIVLLLALLPSVYSVCTTTIIPDRYSFFPLESFSIDGVCSSANEVGQAYVLFVYNGSNQVHNFTGITPALNTHFFNTFTIPSSVVYPSASVNLTGTNLEGTDTFNVSGANVNSLVISNINVTSGVFLGKGFGVQFHVLDENSNEVSFAECVLNFQDGNFNPIKKLERIKSIDGEGHFSTILDISSFKENTGYFIELHCACGNLNNSASCIDNNQNQIFNSIGDATSSFFINKWLNVSSLTDKNSYSVGDVMTVCANVTNNRDFRVPLRVNYLMRCESSLGNSATDRVIFSDHIENRGISANTVQNQCTDFFIPNHPLIERGATNCYGSTDVVVIDTDGHDLITYSSTSSTFNITSPYITPEVEWIRNNRLSWSANVSYPLYNVSVKDINVLINDKFSNGESEALIVNNWSVKYMNGSAIPYNVVHKVKICHIREDDGKPCGVPKSFITIQNVNTSVGESFNVTVDFVNFEERQAVALEGIENKTGVFHFSIDCNPTGGIGHDLSCLLDAFVEADGTLQKEVDFTCWIEDGSDRVSSLNFNQMVTRDSLGDLGKKKFFVPERFISGKEYTVQCEAAYYNLGSRSDSFSDTFMATDSDNNAGSFIITQPLNNQSSSLIQSKARQDNMVWLLFLALFIIVCCLFIVFWKKSKKDSKEFGQEG